MKKLNLLMLLCIAVATSTYAQIKVDNIGKVFIGDSVNAKYPSSFPFRYKGKLGNYSTICAYGDYNYGLAVYGKTSSDYGPSLYVNAEFMNDRQVAIIADAVNSKLQTSGRSYGIIANAGNRTSGYNYGVVGNLTGTGNGAAVMGTFGWDIPGVNGRYAGFFYGDTYVTGKLTAQTITTLSDARYKFNIRSIGSDALSKVVALNPVQYNMQSGTAIVMANSIDTSDTAKVAVQSLEMQEMERAAQSTTHYGLLAQEVKEIYPELVHEDAAGVMSINYIEIIPLLIQAVQDLSEQVSALSSGNAKINKAPKAQQSAIDNVVATLYQNTPNPFSDNTMISYIVPTDAQNAYIYIYDMTGVQLAQYPVTTFGEGAVTINANELYAGSFLYSLVVDGKLIDTKQMVLTK